MVMYPTLLSTLALLFALFTRNANAGWGMRTTTLLTARMDPLVSPHNLSSHLHNVVGGNKFADTYDYDTLRQSDCSTLIVQEDKSNYWAPTLFYKHRDTGLFELVRAGWAIYYLQGGTETNIQQFPKGFRMIAGSPTKSASGSTPADQAISFYCRGDDEASLPEMHTLPQRHCTAGVQIQIIFPSCWNGVDVTSDNFKDHVAYPVGSRLGGTCPPTHPVRLITIKIEQRTQTQDFEYYDGAFVLSTGDTVGYSSHADFQNGWDASENSLLQQAITTCKDPTNSIGKCEVLKPTLSNYYGLCRPDAATKMPVEDVGIYGGLEKLPGDNPLWGGNVPKVLTGVSNTPPWGSPYSTLPSDWVEHGCINEGKDSLKALTGDKFADPYMYPGLCVDHCNEKGFTLAGLENGKECYCANSLTNGGSMTLINSKRCTWVCPGSLYEFCGGTSKISLYKKTGQSTNPVNGTTYPPVGSKLPQVYTVGQNTTSQTPSARRCR